MGAFDTILLGRKTYEATRQYGGAAMPGTRAYVFSHTLRQETLALAKAQSRQGSSLISRRANSFVTTAR